MVAIASAAEGRILQFSPPELASTVWSFATLLVADLPCLAAVASVAKQVSFEFSAQGLANIAWSFALLQLADRELFDAIASSCLVRTNEFETQAIANTLWAYASVSFQHAQLAEAVLLEGKAKLEEFGPQELATTAWAIAELRCYDHPMLLELCASAEGRLRQRLLDDHSCGLILQALARLPDINVALRFLEKLETNGCGPGATIGLGALLAECESRGERSHELRVLQSLGTMIPWLRTAAFAAAASRKERDRWQLSRR